METIFENIYKNQIWKGKSKCPLSGPGSSLKNTINIRNQVNSFIYDKKCSSILDLGCGDLTWIPEMPFFFDNNIKYTGVDIVKSLIDSHIHDYPNNQFICKNIVDFKNIPKSSVIIIRDVIMHLPLDDIVKIFKNINGKYDYLILTSCNNKKNNDKFNKYNYSPRNIHLSPFNKPHNYLIKIEEPKFGRNLYIFDNTFSNENLPLINKLNEIIGNDDLEGNCMYKHKSNFELRKGNDIEKLRSNLVKLGEINNSILEVGFNGGHSCALFASNNPDVEFLIFDIGRWDYTQRCIDYFMTCFKTKYIKGDSNKTLPKYNATKIYDLIHVDGGHGVKTAENDIRNCKKFADEETLLLVDDANFKRLRDLLDKMVEDEFLEEVEMESLDLMPTKFHRLFTYI